MSETEALSDPSLDRDPTTLGLKPSLSDRMLSFLFIAATVVAVLGWFSLLVYVVRHVID
jgi:hypothetical protein